MFDLKKGFGILALFTAILVLGYWTLVRPEMWVPAVWIFINLLFIAMPLFYLSLGCDCSKGIKNFDKKKLDPTILAILLVISLGTVYQLATGKLSTDDVVWNYIDASAIVVYSFIAGKFLK